MSTSELHTWSVPLEKDGFAIVADVLEPATVEKYCQLVESARNQTSAASVSNSSGTYGLRNLTDVIPQVTHLLQHHAIAALVRTVLGDTAFMTRATLFDKTPGANWGVFWHQDLSVAVREKHDVEGFSAWTRKAGVHCVQPPIELMQRVLTVRIHLDDCTEQNGALKVLPGTHSHRRLATADVDQQRAEQDEVLCEVPAGGVLLMRPMLLHASSPMNVEIQRRVIHFEFANFPLPAPLQWKYQIACGK